MRQVEHTLEALEASRKYGKDTVAEEFESDNDILMKCSSTKEGQTIEESSSR